MSSKSAVVSRRNLLWCATLVAGSTAVLGSSVAPAGAADAGKMSQKAATYQSSPKNGQKCLDCSFFVQPSSCKLVDGTISPVGWCKFFAKKT